jgi:hypothetical protein
VFSLFFHLSVIFQAWLPHLLSSFVVFQPRSTIPKDSSSCEYLVSATIAVSLLPSVWIGDHVGLGSAGDLSLRLVRDSVDSLDSCSYVTLVSLFTVMWVLLPLTAVLVFRVFRELTLLPR